MYYGLINSMKRGAASNPLWNTLLSYFTGDNTPNDAKSLYNGTLVNGATYSSGIINNGFSFDGVNDYIDLGYGYRRSKTDSFSYSFWVNTNSLNTLTVLSNSADNGHFLHIENRYVWMHIGFSSGSYLKTRTTTPFSANTLTHIVVTYDGSSTYSGFKYYYNGVLNSTVGVTNTLGSNDTPNPAAYNLNIGRRPAGQYYFSGILDEIAIFDSVLTSTQVTELYNSGSGKQYPL